MPCYHKTSTSFKKGHITWNKGKPCSEETKQKLRLKSKGKHYCSKNEFKKGHYITWKMKQKMSDSARKSMNNGRFKKGHISWQKGKEYLKIKGDKHPNWKGGITPINRKIRASTEYKLWRNAVFERDNWICVFCGKKGGYIHADHIKPFSLFPELRFAIDNGRTLCINCHRKTPTYGWRGD